MRYAMRIAEPRVIRFLNASGGSLITVMFASVCQVNSIKEYNVIEVNSLTEYEVMSIYFTLNEIVTNTGDNRLMKKLENHCLDFIYPIMTPETSKNTR